MKESWKNKYVNIVGAVTLKNSRNLTQSHKYIYN